MAARPEGLASPGGICISDDAQRQVRGKLDVIFEGRGERQLKNIARPVRVFQVALDEAMRPNKPTRTVRESPQPKFCNTIPQTADVVAALALFSSGPKRDVSASGHLGGALESRPVHGQAHFAGASIGQDMRKAVISASSPRPSQDRRALA